MLTTPDDARKKRCVKSEVVEAEIDGRCSEQSARCIGPACMAWNWHDGPAGTGFCSLTVKTDDPGIEDPGY